MKRNNKKGNIHIPVIFREEPEGGFTVFAPSLPGCVTYGKNLKEAEQMIQEAIELYIEDVIADGESLPQNAPIYLTNINVTLPPARIAAHA